jgi:hypothetical protein
VYILSHLIGFDWICIYVSGLKRILVDLVGFPGFRRQKSWRPAAAIILGLLPPKEDSDPAGLEAWMPGGLDPGALETGWLAG